MILLLIIGAIIIAYYYVQSGFQYWKKRNVPNPPPSVIFGNIGDSLFLKKSAGEIYREIYRDYSDLLYVGYYKIRTPGLIIRDPQLVRDILNKDFNSFHDNDFMVNEEADPLSARNTFVMKGDKWKISKSQISQCFTPKKVREMYVLIENAASKLVNHLEKEINEEKFDGLEVRELFAKFGTEVVATCAFGLEGKTFDEPESTFRKMGKKIFEPSLFTILKAMIMLFIPSLTHVLRARFMPNDVTEYFCGIVAATLKYRKENNIVRNDFLDFMIELRNKDAGNEFTDIDITAHAVGFFVDGFETSSSVMAYAIYYVARNPEVLEKLRREVEEALLAHNGKLNYDSINELKYLDAVLNETLRLHPPGTALLRSCTQPHIFPPPKGVGNGKELHIELNTPIIIPVLGLHTDPKYFKDPEMFKAERFLPENKDLIVRGTYLPFGEGPRACHGQRFGILQSKLAIVNIVTNFDVTVNRRTITPLQIDPKYIVPRAKGGIWINFAKRTTYI